MGDEKAHKLCLLKLTLLGLCLFCHKIDAHIFVYRNVTNQVMEEFNDLPAQFGPSLPAIGLKFFALPAVPICGCTILSKPPSGNYPPNSKFAAIISRGGCRFEQKVRNAENATFSAVIIFNNESDELEQMTAKNSMGIRIPSVFVGRTAGASLMTYDTDEIFLIINDEAPFNINTQLILPFSILIGLCFLVMVFYMIYKCIREQRRLRRYRLPKSMLKKIPIIRYTKNNTDLSHETCVICLEDFVEDDKVRVLPCRHPYHSHCIDPWLTQNRRVCPICKRKVFTKGETRSSRNRQPSLDSITDTEDDSTPLLRQPNGSSTVLSITASIAGTTSTTRHGTFRRNAANIAENASDDENALLAPQPGRRVNPFDRAPNLPIHLADQLSVDNRPLWHRINFNLFFRRYRTNISVAAPPYLESVVTAVRPVGNANQSSRQANTLPIDTTAASHSSNNILNPNLSGSFKDDDDLPPLRSIYEPIAVPTPGPTDNTAAVVADSAFLQIPTHGSIGVVALPNSSNTLINEINATPHGNQRQFFI